MEFKADASSVWFIWEKGQQEQLSATLKRINQAGSGNQYIDFRVLPDGRYVEQVSFERVRVRSRAIEILQQAGFPITDEATFKNARAFRE